MALKHSIITVVSIIMLKMLQLQKINTVQRFQVRYFFPI